jgi:hypothetical protein
MTRRVLINTSYGGFNLSKEAKEMYKTFTQNVERPKHWYMDTDIERDDPILLQVVDTLGLKACSGFCSALGIVEIPDDVNWVIQDYDGMEWVAEKHRKWYTNTTSDSSDQ